MIGGIPLSLLVIGYDVFWVGIVSALVVSHSEIFELWSVNEERLKCD